MSETPNTHAGQGAVVLDIGGNIGALVVTTPPALAGQEIEIRPVDGPIPASLPHVAVVGRPTAHGLQHAAVFAELTDGDYALYLRPDGPVTLRIRIHGGEVCHATWPGTAK
jgi:hypothetical protein